MNYLENLKSNKEIFLKFMSERYMFVTHSNIFLRDIQFAIKFYFEKKNKFLKYPEAEKLANEFTSYLVEQNELIKIDDRTWKVLYSFESEMEVNPNPELQEA
ncbi:MAG: hypothetical protein ABFS12_04590 [Bacteroidota bacterium]